MQLKMQKPESKTVGDFFCYFHFRRNYDALKSKTMSFVEQKYKVKERDEIKNGKSYTQFLRDKPCTSARIRIAD